MINSRITVPIGSGDLDELAKQDLHISSETTDITYINYWFGKAETVNLSLSRQELPYLDRVRDVTIRESELNMNAFLARFVWEVFVVLSVEACCMYLTILCIIYMSNDFSYFSLCLFVARSPFLFVFSSALWDL